MITINNDNNNSISSHARSNPLGMFAPNSVHFYQQETLLVFC